MVENNKYCLQFISRKDVPEEWQQIVDYCKREYGYIYVGVNNPITTAMSGKCEELYFQGEDGVYHCLPTTKFTRRTVNRPPIFAW